jgi:hypothetical protein
MVNPPFTCGMIGALLVLSAATAAAKIAPASPREDGRGVQVVALVTVEILPSARGRVESGPSEPRRQVRRNAAGQAIVEFE